MSKSRGGKRGVRAMGEFSGRSGAWNSLLGLSPRPMAHKTMALTAELREAATYGS